MLEYIDRKKLIISDLAACKKAFDKIKIPWVLMGGVVLGYARYGDVMPWDTDLDIGIFTDIDYTTWQSVKTALSEQGYKRWNTPKGKCKKNEVNDFCCAQRETPIDLCIFHKRGDFYVCAPKTTYKIKYVEKAVWFDDIQLVDFVGDKYPMPNNVEDFVLAHYGPDWRTNIKKNHAEYFNEKRGDFSNVRGWLNNRKRKDDGQLWWPALLDADEDVGDLNAL